MADNEPSNGKGLSHAANAGRHSLADRGDDFYQTPPVATQALLAAEDLPQHLWEPATGLGAIVNVLRAAGRTVTTSDLVDYGFPLDFRQDFLTTLAAPSGVEAIVTNPPYKDAQQFVTHALKLVPRVYMLMRVAFLESERRRDILDAGQLARVHVFRNRLPMMHREGWAGPKASSAVAFAWIVWDRDHTGPTVLDRISWGDPAPYDAQDDIRKSVEVGFAAVRQRKANGGPGWPPESSLPAQEEHTMSTSPPRPHLVEPPDPFDPAALRLDQAFTETSGVKKLLRRIPVRRPHPHDFFRVRPDPDYRMVTAVVDFRDERDAVYLICPPVAREMPDEFVRVTLYTTMSRQGVLALWPVRLPLPDGRVNEWHRSAGEAAELAMKRWVRIKANLSLGAYETFEAGGVIPDPEWPDVTMAGLLKIAFSDRLVDSLNHPVIRRLRGL